MNEADLNLSHDESPLWRFPTATVKVFHKTTDNALGVTDNFDAWMFSLSIELVRIVSFSSQQLISMVIPPRD